MSHQVVFLHSALEDLKIIRRYVRKHFSQEVWTTSYAKIKQAILHLEHFPYSGHAPPELRTTHFLQIIAAKNRVIYEVSANTVYIHIICDSRQDFQTKLARRPLMPQSP